MHCPAFLQVLAEKETGDTMNLNLSLALSILCAFTVAAPVCAADISAGKLKASGACAVCHGVLGVSMMPNAPSLAAQPAIYLAEQLKNYRSGKRSHEVMSVIAKPLSDTEIDDLAAWYASIQVDVRDPGSVK
jgi:cytochrome c553